MNLGLIMFLQQQQQKKITIGPDGYTGEIYKILKEKKYHKS